jgi:hypothetical protein
MKMFVMKAVAHLSGRTVILLTQNVKHSHFGVAKKKKKKGEVSVQSRKYSSVSTA